MNELQQIKITVNQNNEQVVSARSLHEALGIVKRFSAWWEDQVSRLNLVADRDYTPYLQVHPQNHQELKDYILPLDIAKHLCMVSGGEKAWQIRDYFIECEKNWNSPEQIMARALQIANVKMLEYQTKVIELAEKLDLLTHSKKLYTTTEIAKELGFRSANALNQELESMKIQYRVNRTWVLTARYAEKGYVSIKQDILDNGTIIYDRKWTEFGRQFLLDKFAKKSGQAS
jgi:anti-repressor protein